MNVFEQYNKIKHDNPGYLILFQIGEFYEIFAEQAAQISDQLNIILTSKKINGEEIPMCGIPRKSLNKYASLLIELNYKIAIAEEKKHESYVQFAREVTKKFTPGTIMDEHIILDPDFRIISSAIEFFGKIYIVIIDISIGLFELCDFNDTKNAINFLAKYHPKEIVVCEKVNQFLNRNPGIINSLVTPSQNYIFDKMLAVAKIKQLNEECYQSLGFFDEGFLYAIHLLLDYISGITQAKQIALKKPSYIQLDSIMEISNKTFTNLEVFATHKQKGTLFRHVSQFSLTALGKRKIKEILARPLQSVAEINHRLELTEFIVKHQGIGIDRFFSGIGDPERYLIKFLNKQSRQELKNLAKSLNAILTFYDSIESLGASTHIMDLFKRNVRISEGILRHIESSIPSSQILSQNLLLQSINLEITTSIANNNILSGHILNLENICEKIQALAEEIVKYSKHKIQIYWRDVGFVFECKLDAFEAINTRFDGIRIISHEKKISFTNSELDSLNYDIINKIAQIKAYEKNIISGIHALLSNKMNALLNVFENIGTIDAFFASSKMATRFGYTRPKMLEKNFTLTAIKDGFHPMLNELSYESENKHITTNDTFLNANQNTYIITGPNMGGKSVFLKQNGIILIMSHVGMFVPAAFAEISIKDKIFTRIGSDDNLMTCKSTFYVEVEDIFAIFQRSTIYSFVILDELCRSTNPEEGIIIAEETLRHVSCEKKAQTLFATHFHKLQEHQSDFVQHFSISSNLKSQYKLSKDLVRNSESLQTILKFDFPDFFISRIKEKLETITP